MFFFIRDQSKSATIVLVYGSSKTSNTSRFTVFLRAKLNVFCWMYYKKVINRKKRSGQFNRTPTGSTISTLLHDKIKPKDCQVLSLGDTGFLQFFRVVSSDYGKPRPMKIYMEPKNHPFERENHLNQTCIFWFQNVNSPGCIQM